jgi:hypothetical protein
LVYGRLVFPGASLSDLTFYMIVVGWFGLPAGLACGLIGGTVHGLVGGRKGTWLGGLAAAAVTPGFLAWLLDGCPRLKWEIWLGPSIPWVIGPFLTMLALGGWMAARKSGLSRETPRPWKGHLYRIIPALIAAALIVVYQAAYFTGIPLLPPGD